MSAAGQSPRAYWLRGRAARAACRRGSSASGMRAGARFVGASAKAERIGGEDAKRDDRQEDENERKRERAQACPTPRQASTAARPRGGKKASERRCHERELCFALRVRIARMRGHRPQAVAKVSREMAADRLASPMRARRAKCDAAQACASTSLDRVRAQAVLARRHRRRLARTLLQEAAGKAFARALQRSRRRDLVRRDLVPEGNAAGPRQSPVIVGCAEPAIGNHHRMRKHAPFLGERLGAMQSVARSMKRSSRKA